MVEPRTKEKEDAATEEQAVKVESVTDYAQVTEFHFDEERQKVLTELFNREITEEVLNKKIKHALMTDQRSILFSFYNSAKFSETDRAIKDLSDRITQRFDAVEEVGIPKGEDCEILVELKR